jgi:hypothetical protein
MLVDTVSLIGLYADDLFTVYDVCTNFGKLRQSRDTNGAAIELWLRGRGFRKMYERKLAGGDGIVTMQQHWIRACLVPADVHDMAPADIYRAMVGVSSDQPTNEQWMGLINALPDDSDAFKVEDARHWVSWDWHCGCHHTISNCGDDDVIRLCAQHATDGYRTLSGNVEV